MKKLFCWLCFPVYIFLSSPTYGDDENELDTDDDMQSYSKEIDSSFEEKAVNEKSNDVHRRNVDVSRRNMDVNQSIYDKEIKDDKSKQSYSLGTGFLRNDKIKVNPGLPNYDATGRPYQWVPQNGGGSVLGPVNPNAYGPGVGADATGRPVWAVPFP